MTLVTIPKRKNPTKAPEFRAASATSSERATPAGPVPTGSVTPDIGSPETITPQPAVRRKRERSKRVHQAFKDPETDAKPAQTTAGNKFEPFYTVADHAKRWKVSERHVRRLIDSGEVKVSRIGKSIRVPAANVTLYEANAGI